MSSLTAPDPTNDVHKAWVTIVEKQSPHEAEKTSWPETQKSKTFFIFYNKVKISNT